MQYCGPLAPAKHFGVPNALAGVVGYALMSVLALRHGRNNDRQRLEPLTLAALGLSAAVAGAYLTWEQKSKVHAWCFWCLLSTAISFSIAPLAIADARNALRP